LDWAIAACLILLAAAARLYRLDLAEFKLDEATHYQIAYGLTHGDWQWVGSMSSFGIPKPPLFTWALALPIWLSRDPRVATGFLGVLAALSAGGFYWILRRYLGRAAAVGAGLLFALNPQAIVYSRKLFTADLIPPLSALLLGVSVACLESPVKQAGRWAVLAAFSFSLLLLTTFSPILLAPVVVLLFWLRRRDIQAGHYVTTAFIFGLLFSPYLLQAAPWVSRSASSLGASGTASALLGRRLWVTLFGAPWPSGGPALAQLAAASIGWLALAGGAWLLVQVRSSLNSKWALFFLAWLATPPLLALLLPIDVELHYMVLLYPLVFVLPASGVEWAFRRSRWLGVGAFALLVLAAVWQANIWGNSLQAIAQGVEGYGTPVGYWWRAVEQVHSLTEEWQTSEVLLVMPGAQPWDEKAHVFDVLLRDTPHRGVDGQHTVVLPPDRTLLMVASELQGALDVTGACTRDVGAVLPASPFGGSYHYRLWTPEPSPTRTCGASLEPMPARWASGVQLLGYEVTGQPGPGKTIGVTLLWATPRGGLSEDLHWFNHLMDAQGRRWAQFDHGAWPSDNWRPGDMVWTYFDLSVDPQAAPGPYTLRVGQYTLPDVENIPLLDAAGNPTADAAELPLPDRP